MIAIIDYGIGNLRSAEKALQASGADAALVADPSALDGASGIVLPGVGAFGRCADALDRGHWRTPIRGAIARGIPFLGICVGFQLLYEGSQESPGAQGLGILAGEVQRIPEGVKHPQIQWNRIERLKDSQLLPESNDEIWMYFVHSFAPAVGPETIATCDYGGSVAAAVETGSVYGTQFHPEKSGAEGLALLRRFAQIVKDR